MPIPPDFEAQMQLLRDAYARELPTKLDDLEALLQAAAGSADAESLAPVQKAAHSLAGSGATFGFAHITQHAREIEYLIADLRKQAVVITPAVLVDLTQRIGSLRGNEAPPASAAVAPVAVVESLSSVPQPLIYLMERDVAHAEEVSRQLGYYGYQVACLPADTNLAALEPASHARALIIDTELLPRSEDFLNSPRPQCVLPTFFISASDDMQARLQAVRACGQGFFVKPLDMSAVATALDLLKAADPPTPQRILIVEDSKAMADYIGRILQDAGFDTRVLTQPLQVLGVLAEFSPDLILVDMYMPECSGVELAAVVRQQDAFVSVPIVFLSGEQSTERQLEAMATGADDFLTKPFLPEQVVAAVKLRVERHQVIRRYIERDGLTGLLNHTRFTERLDIEVMRSHRTKRPIALAIIDLDHFKRVNDTYGHVAGDHVLRSLSRMLSRRLRQTDIAGRLGGEEFGVILTETDAQHARKVLETLRLDFSRIQHLSGGQPFYCTFSCGLADLSQRQTAPALLEAADLALYEAKRAGRDRVLVFGNKPA
ncbi:GGDEF domain-containing response regulator [Parachitinimonas caeni]|uniref:diguanylate cyclase n=1 Tax=Parachitinimonas caeni TaxID=3031301 RepID=A0ABT7E0X7_9NEIS|nr:diguanylate cyclase [Parachitinimonas caeni]MDK2125974.1 diguanylate cyclase [Parachitinimonas caeni]